MRLFALLLVPAALLGLVPAPAQRVPPPPPAAPPPGKVMSLYEALGMKALGLRGAELDAAVAVAAAHPLGSARNPVRTRGIAGQRAYLARLRCPGGAVPGVLGRGIAPPSPFGGVGDTYAVTCGEVRHAIEMDMYHEHVEPRAVPGFTIVAP